MSAVWIRRDDAQRGSLPARCARSGRRVISRYPHDVAFLPGWLEWLGWTRLWPLHADQPRESIVLPLLPRWQRLHVALRRARDISAAALPIALVALLLTGQGLVNTVVNWVIVAAVAVHLLAAALGLLVTVDVRRDVTGEWIQLSRVSPDFVAEVERRLPRPEQEPMLALPEAVDARADRPATAPARPDTVDPARGA